MSKIFFCSDHHFWHKNILTFTRGDGSTLRAFRDIDHMHEHIIARHNATVSPEDKVYFLGDVSMSTKAHHLEILGRMNGVKVLIKGNHDLCKPEQYLKYFKDIRAVHQFDGVILSHIPIHPESLSRWRVNVHGHLHYKYVACEGSQVPDARYYNVSMECLDDYTPISLEEIKAARKKLFT